MSETLVQAYAEVSGDFNRIHMDKNWATETESVANIAHGNLIVALMTGIIGTEFPGSETILVSQSFKFKRNIYIGSEVKISLRVIKTVTRAGVAYLKASCYSGESLCVDGEFKIFNPKYEVL